MLLVVARIIAFSVPIIFRVAAAALILTFAAFMGLARGAPTVVKDVAANWTNNAIRNGVPIQYYNGVYTVAAIVAGIFYVVGWITLSYLTVFLVERIF